LFEFQRTQIWASSRAWRLCLPWMCRLPSAKCLLSVGAMDAVVVLGHRRCCVLGLRPALAWVPRRHAPPDLTSVVGPWPWPTTSTRSDVWILLVHAYLVCVVFFLEWWSSLVGSSGLDVRRCGSGVGLLRICGSSFRRRVRLVLVLQSGGSGWWTRRRSCGGRRCAGVGQSPRP
jgi:hypothetical protein